MGRGESDGKDESILCIKPLSSAYWTASHGEGYVPFFIVKPMMYRPTSDSTVLVMEARHMPKDDQVTAEIFCVLALIGPGGMYIIVLCFKT